MRSAAVVLLLAGCASGPELGPLVLRERWGYFPQDLRRQENVEKLISIMKRASKSGYNTVLLEDSNFGRLPLMDLVPALFQNGHSENLLAQAPNLAEGLPVKDALFVVKSGEARLQADPP